MSAHTTGAKLAGLTESEVGDARVGSGRDRLGAPTAALALPSVQKRRNISDSDFEAAKAAGIDESMMVKISGNLGLNILTNYTNNFARREIDFPHMCV